MKLALAAMALTILSAGQAQASCPSFEITQSATLARDINGIALGMKLAEVNQIAPISHVAFDTYSLKINNIEYEVEVSPLGRVFQIDSKQLLGRFVPDRQFAASLTAKLTAKYGKPASNQLPGGPAGWSLTELVDFPNIGTFPRTTNSFDVMLLPSNNGGVAMNMMMQDFRILWQDQAQLNCAPAREGENRVQF
jgi:hypothetical protein